MLLWCERRHHLGDLTWLDSSVGCPHYRYETKFNSTEFLLPFCVISARSFTLPTFAECSDRSGEAAARCRMPYYE